MKVFLVALFLTLGVVVLSGASCTKQPTSSNETGIAKTKVLIENSTFVPSNLTISQNTVVTWTNNDLVAHHIISNEDPVAFESGILEQGSDFNFTFTETGTYPYRCEIHPEMKGIITVQ